MALSQVREDSIAFVKESYGSKWKDWNDRHMLIGEYDDEDDPVVEGLEAFSAIAGTHDDVDDDGDDHGDDDVNGDDDDGDGHDGADDISRLSDKGRADDDLWADPTSPVSMKIGMTGMVVVVAF